jgi:hypothetical protein
VDEHRPDHHAVVVEGGKVVAVLSRADYIEVRPNQQSAFAQAWEARKASAKLAGPQTAPSVLLQTHEDDAGDAKISLAYADSADAEIVASAPKEHWKAKQKREREAAMAGG